MLGDGGVGEEGGGVAVVQREESKTMRFQMRWVGSGPSVAGLWNRKMMIGNTQYRPATGNPKAEH